MKRFLQKRYGRALGRHMHNALSPIGWAIALVLLLALVNKVQAEDEVAKSTLYVFFRITLEKLVPRVERFKVPKVDCQALAEVAKQRPMVIYAGCL